MRDGVHDKVGVVGGQGVCAVRTSTESWNMNEKEDLSRVWENRGERSKRME